MKHARIVLDGIVHAATEAGPGLVRLPDGRVLAEDQVSGCRPSSRAPPSPWPSTTPTMPRNWPSKPRAEPVGFLKAANTFVGHRARTFRPADVAFMHYECELAVVIGKTARNVRRDQAYDHVAGYTVANDYALRDYLENWYRPNLRVKSRDTCTPLGPWLVDRDDIPDPMNLTLSTHVNGVRTQLGNTRDMVFDVPALIEYFSSFATLSPGDLILTGTPDGIVNVKPGDEVVTEIEGVGRLVNTLVPCPPDIPHSWNLSMLDTATVRALAARLHEAERADADPPDLARPSRHRHPRRLRHPEGLDGNQAGRGRASSAATRSA